MTMTSNYEFRFVDVGEGLEEGEVVEWLVVAGETVLRDQPLVAVETDKAVVELPSPVAGVISELRFAAGERVKVGEVLVVIVSEVRSPASIPHPVAAPPATLASTAASSSRVKAAPASRRLAVELGVDLSKVAGTGPGSCITAQDVTRAAEAPPHPAVVAAASVQSAPRRSQTAAARLGWIEPGPQPLLGVRRRTAEVMARAWATIPHISVTEDLDATELLAVRDRLRAHGGQGRPRLTVLAFALKAVAAALRRFPLMNASIDTDANTITGHPDIHLGIATSTPDGLLVPVLHNVEHAGMWTVATAIADLAERARARRLRPEDLAGGTFTVTNYGSFGGTYAAPIIRPPEAAILGLGALRERPFVVHGVVAARPVLPVVLAADHRLIDGDVAGSFLTAVCELLRDPVLLLGEG